MKLIIYIDGACRFNPGPAGIGVWIADSEGTVVKEISEYLGHGTNNVAEWTAYIRALEQSQVLGASELAVFSDSKLLCEQARGRYRVRDARLQKLHGQAKELEKNFKHVALSLIPREQNKNADRLAKQSVEGKAWQ